LPLCCFHKSASAVVLVFPPEIKLFTLACPHCSGVVPGRCPPFHAATPRLNTFVRIPTEIPDAFAFFASDLSAADSSYSSGYFFLTAFVYLEGLVSADLSPGAGLYAEGSSSSFFAPFSKCRCPASLVDFYISSPSASLA